MLGATIRPGAAIVAEAVGLSQALAAADLCVTGEGRLDATSVRGKAPAAVAAASADAGVPCVALCGEVDLGPRAIAEMGLAWAVPIGRQRRELGAARAATEEDLAAASAGLGRFYAAVGARPSSQSSTASSTPAP